MPNLGRMGILCRKVSNLIREDWLDSAEANVHAEADSAIDVENEDSERLVARTVRFGAEADRVIHEVAEEYGCSFAEVVRVAVDNRLEEYFGTLRYVDVDTGKNINRNIAAIGTTLQEGLYQMKRIGYNYNQELKLKHIEEKRRRLAAKAVADGVNQGEKKEIERQQKLLSEQEKSLRSMPTLDKKELDSLLKRYEKLAKEIGEQLWLIQQC